MTERPKRFKFEGVTYEFGSIDDPTAKDWVMLQRETRDDFPGGAIASARTIDGDGLHMGIAVALGELFEKLTEEEARLHPDGAVMLSLMIWLSMVKKVRDTGDRSTIVPFAVAFEGNLRTFQPLADPQDRQAPSGKAKKAAIRKASAPAAAPAAPDSGPID